MIPTFGERHNDRVYQPRPAVYALIRNDAGRIAVMRAGRYFFLPGGGIESGEDAESALVREVREECCRTIRIQERLGEALQYFSVRDRHFASHGTYFVAEFTGELEGEPEHELVWLDPVEVDTAVFHDVHRWAIETVMRLDNS